MLQDGEVKIFPLMATNSKKNDHTCYSYIGIPDRAAPKLLPKKASELGCDPRKHFATLKIMQPVTLDDGTIITPDMVTEK